jgi:hypothetical protein
MARASKEDTTISSKRWIMHGMLETTDVLAMKKTAEKRVHFLPRDSAQPERDARLVG